MLGNYHIKPGGCWLHAPCCQAWAVRRRCSSGLGFRVWGLGFRVLGGFRIWGLRLRGVGFKVFAGVVLWASPPSAAILPGSKSLRVRF